MRARRRARDPPGQRARRRLLPRADASASCAPLVEPLERAREAALETRRAGPPASTFPDVEVDYELVALAHPDDYPIERGRIVSSGGLDIAPARVRRALRGGARRALERAALAAARARHATSCGPLARYALNSRPALAARARGGARGGPRAGRAATRSAASSCAASSSSTRCDEALRLIDAYEEPDAPAVAVEPRAGDRLRRAPRRRAACSTTATSSTPRARSSTRKIVPPTSQNQQAIEDDLRGVVERNARPRRRRAARCAASRRSATTTRASRARRTSSTLEVERR